MIKFILHYRSFGKVVREICNAKKKQTNNRIYVHTLILII